MAVGYRPLCEELKLGAASTRLGCIGLIALICARELERRYSPGAKVELLGRQKPTKRRIGNSLTIKHVVQLSEYGILEATEKPTPGNRT